MFDFLSKKFSSLFSNITGQHRLSEKNIDEAITSVRDVLLEADVPYDVVEKFINQVKQDVIGKKIFASLKPGELLMKIVHENIVQFLGGKDDQLQFSFQIPSVVMMVGLQGAGKTTTIAKLAHYAKSQAEARGKTRQILVASVDFYRPAALDQLEILAEQAKISFYRSPLTNPVTAAEDILKYAQKERYDLIFLDTAGRLHVDTAMIEELQHIAHKLKPKYTLLIIDAMSGQESITMAQAFDRALGITGIILTKMDSDTRAGVAFAFKYVVKKPILFAAVGEKIQDLEPFRPERIANRIIGMGDMLSLLEKAQEKIKQSEQDAIYKSMTQGTVTLEDFAQQLDMMSKLGSLTSIVKYLPNAGGLSISPEMAQKGEVEIKKFKAIINSMNHKERIYPKLLDASRKKRVAQGAGVAIGDINVLLDRFEQSKHVMKAFKKMGRFKGF